MFRGLGFSWKAARARESFGSRLSHVRASEETRGADRSAPRAIWVSQRRTAISCSRHHSALQERDIPTKLAEIRENEVVANASTEIWFWRNGQ